MVYKEHRKDQQTTLKELTRIFLLPILLAILSSYVTIQVHVANADTHMSRERKDRTYMLRGEQDIVNKNITDQLNRIEFMLREEKK